MSRALVSSLLVVVALAGCSRQDGGVVPPSEDLPATVALRDSDGRVLANATIDEAAGLRVSVESAELAPGTYGLHLHQTGLCEPPAFASAGPHWNPSGRQHGRLNPLGPHLGDLPNLTVGADGRGTVEFTLPGVSLWRGNSGLADRDGAALVLHAGPDDYRTDPSGNSGARLACGVVVPPR